MSRLSTVLTSIAFLLTACTAPPYKELASAREAVATAYNQEAPTLAPLEYRQAAAALDEGERLFDSGNFKEARESLDVAQTRALSAAVMASHVQASSPQPLQERSDSPGTVEITAAEPPAQAPLPVVPTPSLPVRPSPPPARVQKKVINDYTVAEGETLWSIAARRNVYGDALLWPLIYKANRDQIKDPRQIYPGQTLTIPRDASDQEKETAREVARRSDIFPLDVIIRSRPTETP